MKKFIVLLFFTLSQTSYSQWVACNNGLKDLHILALAVNDSNIFVGNSGDSVSSGIYFSSDNGKNWTAKNNGLPPHLIVWSLAASSINVFAGTQYGIYLSTDNGNTWTNVLPSWDINTIAISGNNIYAGTYGAIFFSSDNGTTWSVQNNGLTNLNINIIAISGNNIFVGTGQKGIYLLTDNGNKWSPKNSGLADTAISSLEISGNNIYAGTYSHGVFFSKDNGNNWIQKNTGITDSIIRSLKINGNNIFAGTDARGVFFSMDSGNRWSKKNFGLLNLHIITLIINSNYIFAGTDESGVFRAKLSEITNVDEQPVKNETLQIYPNPSSEEITIAVMKEFINPPYYFEIYNSDGRLIKSLSSKDIVTKISGLSSGSYFLRFNSKEETIINKFIVTK